MPVGLPATLLLFAQAATSAPAGSSPSVYGPAAPTPPKPAPALVKTAERECAPPNPDPKANEIVVCAQRPQGYRLPPDIVEARRLKKQGQAGRPHNPHETYADHSCATVGPMGCRGGPTINLLAAAATLAKMGDRLSKGEEIGSMFVTDPTPSEYQYYQQAKKEREEKEADAAAKKVSDAAKAAAAAKAADAAKAAQAARPDQTAK